PQHRIELAVGIEVFGLGEDPFVAHERAHFGERVQEVRLAHTRRYRHRPDASSSDTVVGGDCTGPGARRRASECAPAARGRGFPLAYILPVVRPRSLA